MAEAVARVARRVNEVVENGGHHLDLSSCALNAFPTGLYLPINAVADKIYSISLANNELKSLMGKFFTTFKELQELNLEGNLFERLPDEASSLCNLKVINLSRNKLDKFPDELTKIQSIESINLEGNQIKDIPVETLNNMPHLSLVNVKLNPINKENLNLCTVKYELAM
ncbi:leucine-rich repeat-containing protein 20 [Mixophyes fleayi]|uniref:leucine-rich repeat-containing protein 20 n=1 Tax=Mixophyes fleayi TaxID=3061075 RepID=UPI003F4E05BC